MKEQKSPFKCHLFVCTNIRDSGRAACGDHGTADLKATIKAEISNRGWKGTVRVSESGCLGVCEEGPNIMVYPQQLWFSAVSAEDLSTILKTVEDILENEP